MKISGILKRGIAGLVKRLRINLAYIGETVVGNTEGYLGSMAV